MKLRIQGQSIRLRLTQKEVAKLVAEGNVSESVRFSGCKRDQFTYTLEARQGASTVSASYSDGHVRVTIPMPSAKQWANTDQVGIEQIGFSTSPLMVSFAFVEADCASARGPERTVEKKSNSRA